MTPQDTELLESAFRQYYFSNFDSIRVPSLPRRREFGYQKFNSGMSRHIAVADDNQLRLLIANNNPSDIYCSNGYYLFPNLPMTDKQWQSADLIFDIDAKDLNLPCRPGHTCTKCTCGNVYPGTDHCPKCGDTRRTSKSVTCSTCIDAAARQARMLSEILQGDFGIESDDIATYFSGNEGFHMHVTGSAFAELGSRERAELVDYILLKDIMPDRLGMSRQTRYSFPEIGEPGLRGRIARALFGTKSRRTTRINQIMKTGYAAYKRELEGLRVSAGAIIDPNVTVDIHRIFRMPGTLNSKSGLAKVPSPDEKFRPYVAACLIGDSDTHVLADCPVRFSLKGRKFGPYQNEQVCIPLYAAVYLICKGFATTV